MTSAASPQLDERLGDLLERHQAVSIEGRALSVTLRPRDGAELARVTGALGELSLAALVRGAGSELGIGNPLHRADALLSTERLRGVDVFEPEEGVCHVLAGTPLAEVRAAVEPEGWELPLDPPTPRATLGGVLAAASVGPRCHGFGPPRSAVLGLEIALASGERVRCGGRVVKNVTGYDLAKLFVGSFGSLGVIEGAWLRLHPRPERRLDLALGELEAGRAAELGLATARRATTRAAAIAGEADGGCRLLAELAGVDANVQADARWLEECGALPGRAADWEPLRARQAGPAEAGALRFRLAVGASRLAPLLAGLREVGAEWLAYPGQGLVWARLAIDTAAPEASGEEAWRALQELAAGVGAGLRLEAAPLAVRGQRDVFGQPGGLPLMRALKARFDPAGVLNPGRCAGRL